MAHHARSVPPSAGTGSDSRVATVLQHAAIALYTCDGDLRYTWLAAPLLGLEPATMLGHRDDELFPSEAVANLAAFKRSVLASGRAASAEIALPLPGGTLFHEVRAEPLLDSSGGVAGLSVASIDITARRAMERQAEREVERNQILARATREGVLLHDGERVIEVNDAFCRMFGVDREGTIGASPMTFVAPEWRDYALAQAAAQARGPSELVGQRSDGTPFPLEVVVQRFEFQGRLMRIAHIRDLTAQKQAEAALRESEERYRSLAAATREGIIIHDGERIVEVNDAFCVLHGTTREGAIGRPAYHFIAPESLADALAAIGASTAAPYETWARREDGSVFPIEAAGRPMMYQSRLMRVATVRSLSERQRAEAALRESEERFRSFAEASHDVMWVAEAPSGRLEYLSPSYERIFGDPADTAMRDIGRWNELVHPEDRDRVGNLLARTLAGERLEAEYRIVRPDGEIRWIRDTGFPIHSPGGKVRRVAGLARDITRRKENEARQGLLLGELNHRVKNTLATVQSIARQTIRHAASPAMFKERFEDRLLALSKTHNLLTDESWQSASLLSLLDQELSPYGKGRYELANGGDVQLAPRAAVALGMALHELTTNAAKHGALSVPGGNVAVTWELSQAPGAALRLIWRERGGPAIEAHPSRRGFGSQLLERGITAELGGTVDLDFTPAGLEALIVVPLDRPNVPAS